MPVYEYGAVEKGLEYCQSKFEVKQGINEEPLKNCPKCGALVKRLISLPTVVTEKVLTNTERFFKSAGDSARERVAREKAGEVFPKGE